MEPSKTQSRGHRPQISDGSPPAPRASLRALAALIALLLIPSAATTGRAAPPPQTQSIPLTAGWNQISIQVGPSFSVAEFESALGDANNLIELWSYTPSGSPTTPGSWTTYQPKLASYPNDIATVEPGKAYWLRVAVAESLTLAGVPWDGTITVRPGWNFLGFPGLNLATSEAQELSAVFGEHFDSIQQVWAYNTATQRNVGYDLASIPQLDDLDGVHPGQGYWAYSTAAGDLALTPEPFVALPADSDVPAPQVAELFSDPSDPRYLGSAADKPKYLDTQVRFRGAEDTFYDLDANGILDGIETQDTILFEQTAGTSTITVGNNGNGALTWTLENTVPWLFTVPPDEKAYLNNKGRPQSASGTVSSDKDLIILYADRRGLSPGRHGPQTITLHVGGEERVIDVMVDVADISGDWSGYAATHSVNGEPTSLGEVRLVMNAFLKDGETEGSGFRAVIDREKAILFPRDVFLEGVFYSDSQFQLTTNFAMPAGDRNAPPFATFPTDPDDRDFNNDGRVDVMNPFPFGVRREVTLLGTRVTPNRLEGTYVESIRGMLPPQGSNSLTAVESEFVSEQFLTTSQPIIIQGEFVLERDSFEPTKRSVFNEETNPDLPLGGSDTQSRTVTLNVGNSFTVQGVTLSLDLDYPDPALMRIVLISPDGTVHVVHKFGEFALPNGQIAVPGDTFKGKPGFGDWQLQIEWDSTERGTLHSWGLNLEGVAFHRVTGQVAEEGTSNPLSNVNLRLEGSVQPQQITSADGSFDIDELTENDYTLFISKPGYVEKALTFFIGEADVALGSVELTPLAITEPELRASPEIGFQPFTTTLSALVPSGYVADTVDWDFGDTSPVISGPLETYSTVEHLFHKVVAMEEVPAAGYFTVTATLKNTGTTIDTLTTNIHVHRTRADTGLAQNQIVLGTYLGALAARTDAAANVASAAPIPSAPTLPDYDNSDPASPSATVYQETKWHVGTVDIDLLPLRPDDNTFDSDAEDVDFQGEAYIFRDPTNPHPTLFSSRPWQAGDPSEDLSPDQYYQIPQGETQPERFRMSIKLGGSVFSLDQQSFGGTTFQPGRTLE